MRINVAIPEAHVDAPVLDAALESVTRLNEKMLAQGEVPTFDKALKKYGIQWKPEPPGAEHFDHAATVINRRWGDCDDLAPYHAATLRHTGEDPGATAIVKRSGPHRWHAVVQRSNGDIDDPSKSAGMGQPCGHRGAWVPVMAPPTQSVVGAYLVRPQIALRPVRGAFQARADLPWNWREHLDDKPSPTDVSMTALHTAPMASTALTGAIDGIIELGECAGFSDPSHVNRLSAIADCCSGMPYPELVHIYGHEDADAAAHIVGSLFGSLARAVSHVVQPIANVVTKTVPQFAQSIVRSVSNLPSFVSHFASDPRGAVMNLAHDLGSIKIGPVPLGASNLIWLADAAARKGLGPQLYDSLSHLGPKGIPNSPAVKQAEAFVHNLAAGNPALQSFLQGASPHLGQLAHVVRTVAAHRSPAALDAMIKIYASRKLRPAGIRHGLAAIKFA